MHRYSIEELHTLFVSGDLSAESIVQDSLARIKKHDHTLNAFLSVYHERALEQARALDKKRKNNQPVGKLAGVPIAIKDNILIKGEITTCASKFLANYKAPYDATVVRLLEEEDAILIGKTNMDEFAMGGSGTHSAFSVAKNPWNLECTPGGSSSGSSAAVSGCLCPVALGSDTGGSIRQPAAFTGITGFKPTYGRISRYGIVAFGSSLDQIGPMTHTAKDAAWIMNVLGKGCEFDSTSIRTPSPDYIQELAPPIKGAKIGVPWKFLEKTQGEARQNFEESLKVFKELGATIVDIDLSTLKYGIAAYYVLATAEASANLARFDGIRYGFSPQGAKTVEEVYEISREDGFGWEVKNRILLGTYILSSSHQDAYYAKAQKARTLIIQKLREAFDACDVIAIPTAPGTAFPLVGAIKDPFEEYLQDLYTVGANLAGLPAISIPSGFSTNGLPFGFQLMGPQMHDANVLRHAHAFQSVTTFAKQLPPNFGDPL